MSWWKQRVARERGQVAYLGAVPPRAENFAQLAERGFTLRPLDAVSASKVVFDAAVAASDVRWALAVSHPRFGAATFVCARPAGAEHEPPVATKFALELTDAERAAARASRSAVVVAVEPRVESVLAGKKRFLRFLGAACGDGGTVAADWSSSRVWSRAALDEELAHDADVDIDALFAMHLVTDSATGENEPRAYWAHTHGLRELGFVDFDLLAPATVNDHHELVRALAFAIVEGALKTGGPPRPIVHPGGCVRLVDAREFAARAGAGWETWRADLDDEHTDRHAIVCEPAPGGLRKLFGSTPKPTKLFAGGRDERSLVLFSRTATELMAVRARGTYSVFPPRDRRVCGARPHAARQAPLRRRRRGGRRVRAPLVRGPRRARRSRRRDAAERTVPRFEPRAGGARRASGRAAQRVAARDADRDGVAALVHAAACVARRWRRAPAAARRVRATRLRVTRLRPSRRGRASS